MKPKIPLVHRWYQILNDKVFFWLTERRLETLLAARAYRRHEHCVITVFTAPFVHDYRERIWLSAMNSGTTKPIPHPRGPNTYQLINDYPFKDWTAKRHSPTKAIAELALDYAVPNIAQYVEQLTIRNKNRVVREGYRYCNGNRKAKQIRIGISA